MFDNEIIEVGNKLIKIRKTILYASQSDIAGDDLSTSQISKIERGDSIVTKETGKKIYATILKIGKEKKIEIDLTFENFIETAEEQQTKALTKIISDYQSFKFETHTDEFWESKITTVKKLIDTNLSCKEKALAYESISDIYLQLNNFNESILFTLMGFEMYMQVHDRFNAIRVLSNSLKHYKFNYKEMNSKSRFSYSLYNDYNLNDDNILKKILFCAALSYKKLSNYSDSIMYLDKLIFSNIKFTNSELLDMYLLKAYCLMFLGSYAKSEQLNLENLERAKNSANAVTISRIYINIAELYRRTCDFPQANKYTELSLLIKDTISQEDYCVTLYSACIHYIETKNVPMITRYIYTTLVALKKINDNESINILVCRTIEYFNQHTNLIAMENFKAKITNMFNKQFKIDGGNVYTKLSNYKKS